jgi:thiamine-phosphate pyrophosphorylase
MQNLRGLYAITMQSCDTDTLVASVQQALQGGVRLIQYRDKSTDTAKRRQQAGALKELCHAQGALLLINDDIELAAYSAADGVHIGQEDGTLDNARTCLGKHAIIGVSCYNRLDIALQAANSGADYVAFGSFYPSATKPTAVCASLDLLSKARAQLNLPICAIGGITPANAAPLIATGADMIAVIHGIFGQTHPCAAAQAYANLFHLSKRKQPLSLTQ